MTPPPNLDTAVGRVMFAVGDHDEDDVLLVGGKPQYKKLLARVGGSERAAWIAAGQALGAYYAAQPVRISKSGKSIDYSDRVPTWLAIGRGELTYPFAEDGTASAPATGSPQAGLLTAGTTAARKLR